MVNEAGGGGGFIVTGHPGALEEWSRDLHGLEGDLDSAREDARPDAAFEGEEPGLADERASLVRDVGEVVDRLRGMSLRAEAFAWALREVDSRPGPRGTRSASPLR